jgi:hypothetical protein
MLVRNFVKEVVSKGGRIIPLIITPEGSTGTGLMNPSVFNDGETLLVNIRHINYTLWHSENKQLYNSCYGPLVYFNPEDDIRLATKNYLCTLGEDRRIKESSLIKTDTLDSPTPLWEFHGLEDGRLFRWDSKLFLSGVRRDTTTNGEGRMELSELVQAGGESSEVSRQRIPMPAGQVSYCEKNWMPIIDMPYHYVKWANPTEVIRYDPVTKETTVVVAGKVKLEISKDPRGGSQVIPYKGYRIAIVHEVDLYNNIQGQKDADYRHRFIIWDKDWNIVRVTDAFSFMDAKIEFSCGMCIHKGDMLISFGFQDNAAFLLEIPGKEIDSILGLDKIDTSIVPHIYQGEQFGEDWFTYPRFYSEIVKKFPSGTFVEVGSWKGKSAAYMATEIANSKKDIKFYCVDKWESVWDTFHSNMLPLEKYYTPLRTSSVEGAANFADESLDFVFIDASHEYEDVKNDIIAWMPKVRPGGIIAGHDYHADQAYHPGVYKAVHELIDTFTVSEMCWIHEKKIVSKLTGMPSVYCLSLEESSDRRDNLVNHFKPFSITPKFCLFPRYKEGDQKLLGTRLDELNLHAKGSNVSNLLTIKKWYDETSEDYGFIVEDDLSLETVKYWGFTWQDFINRLPMDWECVQLIQIRPDWSTHKLKVRESSDLCNAAYIVKREYAKKLIDKYITPEGFDLECGSIPVPENILFSQGVVYSIPLFVEDVVNTVTTFPDGREIRQSEMHEDSYIQILNFWKDNGDKFTVKDFTPRQESWKHVKSPILEITTNVLAKGCAVGCVFCPQMTLLENYKGERMLSFENFKTMVDKTPKGVGIIFAGFSEPWLNKECTKMVMYAHEQGHKISLFTTGVGMTKEDIDLLKTIPYESGPNRGFTLHVPDIEGYTNHHATDNYVELLEYMRDSNISCFRVISMGTAPENVKKVFPTIYTAEMYSRAGNLQREEIFKPKLKALRDKYLSVDNGGESHCISPEGYNHTVILPNGDMSICCQDYELKGIVGNLLTQEYNDLIPELDASFSFCRYCENGRKNG